MVDETNFYIYLERGKTYLKGQYAALTWPYFGSATILQRGFELSKQDFRAPAGIDYELEAKQDHASIKFDGTPTQVEYKIIKVDLNDLGGNPDRHFNFHLKVFDISITCSSEPPIKCVVGQKISDIDLIASGGSKTQGGVYKDHEGTEKEYTFNSLRLPSGLQLTRVSDTKARLSGTPTTAGTFDFWISATDGNGIGGAKDAPLLLGEQGYHYLGEEGYHYNGWSHFDIEIEPEIRVGASPRVGHVAGEPYRDRLSASGGEGSYTYIKGKSAPQDLQVNEKTGEITWTSPTAGAHEFWLGAYDKKGNGAHVDDASDWKNGWYYYKVTIAPEPTITITPPSKYRIDGVEVDGRAGSPYSGQLHASGGAGPYVFSKDTGNQDGLEIGTDGHITWTPHAKGPFNVYVTVKDHNGHQKSDSFSLQFASRLSFSQNLPNVVAGHSLDGVYVHAGSGTSPYTYSFDRISGPRGIDIDTKTGKLTGTPDGAGELKFRVSATDGSQYKYDGEHEFSLTVEPAVMISSEPAVLEAVVGEPFSARFRTIGGTDHYTYKIFDGAPKGLSVDGDSGILSGVPEEQGLQHFVLGVTECTARLGDGTNGRKNFSIDVGAGLKIEFPGPLTARVGTDYHGNIHVTGGKGKPAIEVTGLDNGLSWNGANIVGRPSSENTVRFMVKVTDAGGGKPKEAHFEITVAPAASVDLAIGKLLHGRLARISGDIHDQVEIRGQLAGGGLSETLSPEAAGVILKLQQPGSREFVELGKDGSTGKLSWEPKWKPDGWEFTISGIKWQPGRDLPKFQLLASLSRPEHFSEPATVRFPLQELVTNVSFRDEGGETIPSQAVSPGDMQLKLHMGFNAPIDNLSVRLILPDGITGKKPQNLTLPPALKFKDDWNGHLQPVLFEITDKEWLLLGEHKPIIANILVPVTVTSEFRTNTITVQVTSTSDFVEIIPNSTKPVEAVLDVMSS